ncbi:MAG: polyprenol monophosphomannose synthase [Chloroflexota bacterium]
MHHHWNGQALIIIPTYNERENLERLITQLRALSNDIHVLIVDDNSPDGTGEIADRLATTDGHIHVIHRPAKLGLGTAYQAGFRFGLIRHYQYICTMDADFSHNPASLPTLLDKAAGLGPVDAVAHSVESHPNLQSDQPFDMVVGSRYVPGGNVVGWPWHRIMLSYSANWLAHAVLGTDVRDCTAGFRCYRRQVLETINLDAIFSNGYSFLIEMAFHCQQAGFRMGEVPIVFVNRTEGSSKISKWEILRAIYTLVRLRTSSLPWERMVGVIDFLRNKPVEMR